MATTPILLLLCFSALFCTRSDYIAYNTSQRIVPGKINVHLVPHSHDDVGWLKTVDQYYVGSNNSIRVACVQNVLDSVVSALLADKNRRFIYVEIAFFQRWWRQQSDAVKRITKDLVTSGQLEFINGGMCMHDEATPHYIDMIDQTTLGHRFVKQEFGQTPRVGWQIDPFGHSAIQAYLLGAEVGFDSLFFARIDYQDRAKRKDQKSLEVIWRGSKTLESSSEIFTGIFPVHYDPPPGFFFEFNDDSPLVQDDINLFDYNVQERVNDFVAAAIKQDGRVNVLYSTPSIYTDAKHAANESWPLKTDDFFPYADRVNAYWTGYFTSRPAFKGYVRMMSAYYLTARQLEFLLGRKSSRPKTDTLADALAIAQHHDAVSGTERQHVASDYAKRLYIGYTEAAELVESALACLTESSSTAGCDHPSSTKFEQCPLLNISYCPSSEIDLSRGGKSLVVVVYNSLGWKREDIIRIPVISESLIVHDSKGKEIQSQLIPIVNSSVSIRDYYVKAYLGVAPGDTPHFWLAFSATVPPLGFNTYIISSVKRPGSRATMSTVYIPQTMENGLVEVGPGNVKLTYAVDESKLTKYSNARSSVEAVLEQSYSFYTGDNGNGTNPQASGAYVFRPNGTFAIKSEGQAPLTVIRGSVLDEVHQQINPWIYQISRVYKEKEHAEIEFTVGPVPIDDGSGKEIATQITSKMKTNKTFYTDSNGRDFIKRIRDYRTDWDLQVNEPVAGNYYPQTELSILVDRSIGGSSLVDGQIELMLHRRLIHDDSRGVGEALNETVCVLDKCTGLTVRGKFYIRIDPAEEGAKWRRTFGQEIYSPLLLAFTEQDGDSWTNSHVSTFTAMDPTYSLPDNVAMITLQELEDGNVLLRLAHLFEMGEDKDLSVMAKVELKKVFPKKIMTVTEMGLSANQERKEMLKKKLVWKVEGSPDEQTSVRGGPVDPSKLVVELGPMEIRTFVIVFDYIKISVLER